MTDHFDTVMEYVDKATDVYLNAGADNLDKHEMVILSVWMLEAEVNNGGFDQYYWNSAGDFSLEVIESLGKIGATETAELVKAANSNFGEFGPPRNREQRQKRLEELEASGTLKLDALDTEFYEYPNDLTDLMYEYIVKNGLYNGI